MGTGAGLIISCSQAPAQGVRQLDRSPGRANTNWQMEGAGASRGLSSAAAKKRESGKSQGGKRGGGKGSSSSDKLKAKEEEYRSQIDR